MSAYFVYILANEKNGTLYVGYTIDLNRRVYEHKQKFIDSFTKKYSVSQLVYFEIYDDLKTAMEREHRLKKWRRKWKIDLIEKTNGDWRDLYYELLTLP